MKKGTPRDLFWPRPGSSPGGIWPKNNNTCKGPWVLHPYQDSSKSIQRFWRRSPKCEKFTDGRTTDGRRTDGRCAMTIAHSSLWLRWAKNGKTFDTVFNYLNCHSKYTIDLTLIFQAIQKWKLHLIFIIFMEYEYDNSKIICLEWRQYMNFSIKISYLEDRVYHLTWNFFAPIILYTKQKFQCNINWNAASPLCLQKV